MTRCAPEWSVDIQDGGVGHRRCVHASSTKTDLSLSGALLPLDYIYPCCFRGSFQLQIHPHESTRQKRRRSTSYQGNLHHTSLVQLTFAAVHPTQAAYFHLSSSLSETNEVRVDPSSDEISPFSFSQGGRVCSLHFSLSSQHHLRVCL